MGTSSSFKGIGKGKPLTPSWAGDGGGGDSNGNPPDDPNQPDQPDEVNPEDNPQETETPSVNLTQARINITKYVRNNRDQSYLRRGISSYVKRGLGGSSKASGRMVVSRKAATRLYSVVQNFITQGTAAVIERFHLHHLRDTGLQSIFTELADFVCTPTSGLDEAITRNAYLQTVALFPTLGINDQGEMTAEMARDIMLTFITETIFTRVLVDIGEGIRKHATDSNDIIRIERDIHGYIQGSIQDRLRDEMERVGMVDQKEIERHMQEVYEIAFEILEGGDE